VYRHDGSRDNDLGLTWLLIDFERTIQDCYNKIVEWKNRALNPQMIAPVNSIIGQRTDEPGDITYYKPQANGLKPEWEQPVQPPQALYQLIDRALNDMRDVAGDNDFNADPNVAAKTVNAVDVQTQSRWEKFMSSVEEWDSRLMRHCLLLVARHYTEPRLVADPWPVGSAAAASRTSRAPTCSARRTSGRAGLEPGEVAAAGAAGARMDSGELARLPVSGGCDRRVA
jgi:hypothetical protein